MNYVEQLSAPITDANPVRLDCFHHHLGPWGMWPDGFRAAFHLWSKGKLACQPTLDSRGASVVVDGNTPEDNRRRPYRVDSRGIAHLHMMGVMTKFDSKFGGINTVRTRMAIREIEQDAKVLGAMAHLDSPGGNVAGTADLVADFRRLGMKKPTHVQIADMGASCAFWFAAQAGTVTMNRTGLAGSIGVILIVEDSSEQAAAEGVKVHVLSTGEFKGAGASGTEVTDSQLAYFQKITDSLGSAMFADIAKGRGVPLETVRGWADGKIYSDKDALAMGLIDGIATVDEAANMLATAIRDGNRGRRDANRNRLRMETARSGGG